MGDSTPQVAVIHRDGEGGVVKDWYQQVHFDHTVEQVVCHKGPGNGYDTYPLVAVQGIHA